MAKNTIADLDTTAANNTDYLGQSAAGTASANTVDTIFANLGGLLARFYADIGALGTVGGTADAITVTSASTYQTLESGLMLAFKASGDNTGAATLNLDALGAKAIRKQGDSALAAGEIVSGGTFLVRYDAAYNTAAGAWVLLNPINSSSSLAGFSTLADPGADRILFWDDSAGVFDWLTPSTGLTITTTSMTGVVAASQAEMEAATSTSVHVSPGRQQYHPGNAKCWALVAVSGGTPSLTSSHNITSITDTGTGLLTVTIATDFSSVNWAAVAMTKGSATTNWAQESTATAKTAGAVVLRSIDQSGSMEDPLGYNFVGFGDQ